jgi:WXG100 family type VII secretion target
MDLADFHSHLPSMDQGQQELINHTKVIESYLEELDSQVKAVRSEMDGQAIEAYDTAHRQWMTKVNEMREVLGMGSKTLGQVAMNYTQVDGNEQAKWSNLSA